jgi:negative regulator of flagellin synthesis FlgM
MAIDINNRLGPLAQSGTKTPEQARSEDINGKENAVPERNAAAADSVKISEDAASLRAMQAKLEGQDSFDEARVNKIKLAIANGDYPIDNQRLAEKFLQLESKL